MTKHALPFLRQTRGSIVYTGSISGISGSAQLSILASEEASYVMGAVFVADGVVVPAQGDFRYQ